MISTSILSFQKKIQNTLRRFVLVLKKVFFLFKLVLETPCYRFEAGTRFRGTGIVIEVLHYHLSSA